MRAPTVSVVIPTRDRLVLLRRSLRALLRDPAVLEVVVVDTGRDPLARAWLARVAAGEPRLVALERTDAAAAPARQAGLDRARGERVLFLDDDVVAEPGLAGGHVARAAAVSDPARTVVVGATPPALHGVGATAAERVYAAEYARRTAGYADGDAVLRHLWGGNFSLPAALAHDVGMTPRAALPYHEDRDLGLRLLAAGAVGVWAPELAATHHHRRRNEEGARDARRRAAAAVALAALHPASGPPPAPDRDLPAAVRAMLGACRRPGVHRAAVAAAAVATGTAAQCRARGPETAAYKLWRRLEEQRGIAEAAGRG